MEKYLYHLKCHTAGQRKLGVVFVLSSTQQIYLQHISSIAINSFTQCFVDQVLGKAGGHTSHDAETAV